MMERVSDCLVKLAALGLIAMTGVIGWQVFGRFVLNSSPSWTEQTSLLMMIWYVFFAAAAGVWERFHIRIELLEEHLSEARARQLRIATHIVIAGFGLVLLFYGAQLVWLVHEHVVPSLGISRGLAYLPIPFAGLLVIIFSIGRVRAQVGEGR